VSDRELRYSESDSTTLARSVISITRHYDGSLHPESPPLATGWESSFCPKYALLWGSVEIVSSPIGHVTTASHLIPNDFRAIPVGSKPTPPCYSENREEIRKGCHWAAFFTARAMPFILLQSACQPRSPRVLLCPISVHLQAACALSADLRPLNPTPHTPIPCFRAPKICPVFRYPTLGAPKSKPHLPANTVVTPIPTLGGGVPLYP
jgi:hypothetical protein